VGVGKGFSDIALELVSFGSFATFSGAPLASALPPFDPPASTSFLEPPAWGTLTLEAPGFCALAAARAAATLAAAAEGLTAVVEEAALLAVDDVGLVVAELLDLLSPELDLDDVEAGFDGAGVLDIPVAKDGLFETTLLVVADEGLATPGLGLALDVELAFDGCLDTVGVGLGLVAGGREAVEEVGRFGSTLVSTVLVSVGLGLDGLVRGAGGFVDGFVAPFSVDFAASGFLSATLDTCGVGLAGRLVGSGLSAGLAVRPEAPTVDDVGRDPANLGAVDVKGFAGPVLEGAVTDDDLVPATLEVDVVGFEAPVLEAGALTDLLVELFAGLALLVDPWGLPEGLFGLVLEDPGGLEGSLTFESFGSVFTSGVAGSIVILGFTGVGSVVITAGGIWVIS